MQRASDIYLVVSISDKIRCFKEPDTDERRPHLKIPLLVILFNDHTGISPLKNFFNTFLNSLECKIVSSGNQRILILFVFCIGLPVTASHFFYEFS